ncbi:MAG: tetratricopeptide repeat protein [Candidatus Methylomirabilis sp.]
MEGGRIDALKEMLEKDPSDATLYYFLGNEYLKVGKYAETIEAIRTYLSLATDEGAAYRTLAQSLERTGKIVEARIAYQQGIDAANLHSHPGMAAEFEQALKELG